MPDNNARDERLISDMSQCAPASRADASRKTVTITDFSTCEPSTFVSPQPQHPGVWQLLDYEAGEVQGVALYGTENTHAQPIKIPLTNLSSPLKNYLSTHINGKDAWSAGRINQGKEIEQETLIRG